MKIPYEKECHMRKKMQYGKKCHVNKCFEKKKCLIPDVSI